jgi:hypothetical protein
MRRVSEDYQMSKETLKLALSCVRSSTEYKRGQASFVEAAEDIEQALAAPVQEPVAGVVLRDGYSTLVQDKHIKETDQRLYTTPPAAQRQWVGLQDEEIDNLSREMVKGKKSVNWLSYSIEAKLKEKNT